MTPQGKDWLNLTQQALFSTTTANYSFATSWGECILDAVSSNQHGVHINKHWRTKCVLTCVESAFFGFAEIRKKIKKTVMGSFMQIFSHTNYQQEWKDRENTITYRSHTSVQQVAVEDNCPTGSFNRISKRKTVKRPRIIILSHVT